MKNPKYYVVFDYGIHHKSIETNFKDFTEIINEMKSEFKVYEEREEMEDLRMICLSYSVLNYIGHKYMFAYILADM